MKFFRKARLDVIVPVLVSLVIFAASTVLFVNQKSSIDSQLSQETRLVGSDFAARLQTNLDARLKAGRLLGQRFIATDGVDMQAFRAEAALTHALFEDFQALSWVDAQGVIRIVTPEEGNAAAINLDLRTLPLPAQALALAEDTETMQVTPPIELAQGGRGFTAYVPINGALGRRGFLNIVFRSELLFANILAEREVYPYALSVMDNGAVIFQSSETAVRPDIAYNNVVDVGPRQWQVTVAPTAAVIQRSSTWLDEATMVFGLLASIVFGIISRFAIVRQRSVDEVEARLRDIADSIDDVVWVNSADFRETRYINPAFEKIFGHTMESIRKDPTNWTSSLAPEEAEKISTTIMMVLEKIASGDEEQIERFEYPIYKVAGPDGISRDIYARSVAMRDARGQIDRFVGVATDVTELLRTQEDLRKINERLVQSQKMESVGQLTGGLAHDFNNLLAVILGNIELIEKTDFSDESQTFLSAAKTATLRGADLTKSLLSFARQSSLQPAKININEMARETKNWSSRVIPENIEVEISLLAGLWQVEIDPTLTQNALLNLILNARDAMPDGGKLTIETSNVRIDDEYNTDRGEDAEPGRYVMLAVSDTGIGIPDQNQAHIFDPFFTTKPVGAGSGLGLSMIQGFVKQSGGIVRVYSEPNVGTTFKLYFKAISGEREAPALARPNARQSTQTGARICVVEDEEAVLKVIVNILSKTGYQITAAHSGDEAMQIFDEGATFDLLVTDIVMPGTLQGTQLARALRERHPDLPVVFMSGYANEATVHGNGLRPEDIRLMKPVSRADLVAAVEKAINAEK